MDTTRINVLSYAMKTTTSLCTLITLEQEYETLTRKDMYKFYKLLGNGNWKYTETFNSTLDPNYHEYINWCKDNDVKWKLVRTFDNLIMHEG